jgi:hypothetical protein
MQTIFINSVIIFIFMGFFTESPMKSSAGATGMKNLSGSELYYLTDGAREKHLMVENWMTSIDYFIKYHIIEEEAEAPVYIEEWMISTDYFIYQSPVKTGIRVTGNMELK